MNLRKVKTGCCEEEARLRFIELIFSAYTVSKMYPNCIDVGVEIDHRQLYEKVKNNKTMYIAHIILKSTNDMVLETAKKQIKISNI